MEGDTSRLADELAIRIALSRIALLNDGGDLEDYVSCSNARHLVTNQVVRFEGPDSAICEAYLLHVTNTTTTPTVSSVYRLKDTLRRTSGGWKVARHTSTRAS